MDTPGNFGCTKCYGDDADAAYDRGREPVHTLIDDSHFGVSIQSCATCGQRFVVIFTEIVDWVGGDDSQYCDILPVTEQEAADLARQEENVDLRALGMLGDGRRRLVMEYPRGGEKRVLWKTGAFTVYPGH